MTPRTRRQLLVSSGTVGLVAIAGCGDPVHETDPPEDGEGEGDETFDPDQDIDHQDVEGSVEFVQPDDGAEVTSPVSVEFDVEDLEIDAADDEPEESRGHMHLLIDVDCVEPGELIPQGEEEYIHYSEGELEDSVELEPGEYDLCAQAGDDAHIAYDLTDEISVTVVADDEDDT